MESNQKKGQNKKVYHLKKQRKTDDRPSFNPRTTFREENEKPVLFQLGSIASYGVCDVHHKAEPKTTSLSLSSISETSSSDDLIELSANEIKSSIGFESNQHNKEFLRVSSRLSDNTPRSQVSGVTYASLEPPSLSPTQSPQLQMMDREESGCVHPQRNLENNLSTISNESLFSLNIGDSMVGRDELFSYRDFKPGEGLKSGELLSFSPSIRVPVGSGSTEERSSDIEDKESEEIEVRTSRTDSEDKSSNSNVSWRNLTECNNLEEAPINLESFPSPITKKSKRKKKVKKKTQQQQQQQQQLQQQKQTKRRCSWLCCLPSCKNTWSCFSCSWCGWPSCTYGFCCYKRLKCFSCCSWPSCNYSFSCYKRLKCCSCTGCFSCGWLFCCCYSSRSKKIVDEEEHQVQNIESKTSQKWFCCFPCCSSS